MARRKFSDLPRDWSSERKAASALRTAELEREMTVSDIRRACALDQPQVAQTLGISKAQISQIEHQPDLYISTLRRFLGAMNLDLVPVARTPDGGDIEIKLRAFGRFRVLDTAPKQMQVRAIVIARAQLCIGRSGWRDQPERQRRGRSVRTGCDAIGS